MIERGEQLFGEADYRNGLNLLARAMLGGTCFVDGVEIEQVCYANTETGVVKTYDLRGVPGIPAALADGRPHSSLEFRSIGIEPQPLPDIEAEYDGVVTRTLHGAVEMFAPLKTQG